MIQQFVIPALSSQGICMPWHKNRQEDTILRPILPVTENCLLRLFQLFSFSLQSMRHYIYTRYRFLLVMDLVIGSWLKTFRNRLSISNIFFMLNALENVAHLKTKSKSCISFYLNVQAHIRCLEAVHSPSMINCAESGKAC